MLRSGIEGLEIFGGSASMELASQVAKELGVTACMPGGEFAGGEVNCDLPESIRGRDVYVLQSHCVYTRPSPNGAPDIGRSPQDALMEQMLIVNAARSSWAGRVIAVSPYAGYGRQDRRTGRQSISASMAFQTLAMAGADGMMSIDMHSPQAEGFFNGPFEHLTAAPTLVDYLLEQFPGDEQLVIVSPDNGRLKSAGRYRDQLGDRAGIAVVDKKRDPRNGSAQAVHLVGADVAGMSCVIVDDMIDAAGTITAAARAVQERGATHITALATHGLFSYPAAERLAASPIDRVIVTDTIPLPDSMRGLTEPHIEVVSIAEFLARSIRAVHEGTSIQELHGSMPQRI